MRERWVLPAEVVGRCRGIDKFPVIVGISVRIKSDLLLYIVMSERRLGKRERSRTFASSRIVVSMGVKISTLCVEMENADGRSKSNIGKSVGHASSAQSVLEL